MSPDIETTPHICLSLMCILYLYGLLALYSKSFSIQASQVVNFLYKGNVLQCDEAVAKRCQETLNLKWYLFYANCCLPHPHSLTHPSTCPHQLTSPLTHKRTLSLTYSLTSPPIHFILSISSHYFPTHASAHPPTYLPLPTYPLPPLNHSATYPPSAPLEAT